MSWLKIKKHHCFEVSYSTQQWLTISLSNCGVWQKVDLIWQLATTSPVVGPRSSEALPIGKLVPKNGHGHCLGVCWQSDPLQLSESQWNCSANWWDALKTSMLSAGIGQQKGPNSSPRQHLTTCHITNASKVEPIGLQSFALSIWISAYRLPLLQGSLENFLQGKHFHNLQETQNDF